MAQRTSTLYPSRRHLFLLVLVAAALYVLLPQIGNFRSSWQLLRHPQASYATLVVILTCATYLAAAGTYYFLAFKPLTYTRTLLVQLAAMFVNRLLPAGIGAVGANYLYLKHEKHTTPQAVSVVAVNNLLGFLGHGLLVAVTLAAFRGNSLTMSGRHSTSQRLVLEIVGVTVLLLLAAAVLFGRHKVAKALHDIKLQLLSYRHHPWALLKALICSAALTFCNVLSLFFCLYALGIHLPFAVVLLVFTFGVGAGAAVPTPGGLGGFEAGLAAGFVAYGIDAAPALAVALLYRLVSYWLPLLIGLLAFIMCQRQGLFGTSTSRS